MVTWAPQVALGAALLGACDAPARVKPWRHAPDPAAEAAGVPGSRVLAEVPHDAPGAGDRDHTLRIHVDAEPGRLNPLVQPSVWARRITLGTVFEPLLRELPPAPGEPARYAPGLAKSWRVLPGGDEIRVVLRPGVTFHDGRPLTASDVQFTLDSVRDSRNAAPHLRALLADVIAVELVTPLEVAITLRRPSGWVLRALAEIPILPAHVYDGSLLAGGALIGTGPWRFESNKGGVVHLTRYDKYWGPPAPIADLEFVYDPDAAAALTAAKRGLIDLVPALIRAHWPEQANAPGLASEFAPIELAPPRLRYLVFDAAHPPLDDARVRQALALLVDRRTIAKRVFGGLARPVLWPIWPGGPVDGAEPAVPAFDPAAAGRLLDAAGWVDSDKDGIRDKDGKQLRLQLIAAEPAKEAAPKLAATSAPQTERDYLVEAARRAGVVIEVKTLTEAGLERRLADGSYDLVEMQWRGLADGDVTSLVAGKDPARPAQPAVDRVLDELAAAADPAAREALAPELAAALATSWPIAGIVADAPHGLIARRVHGASVWNGWLDLSALHLDPPK